jgi:hypothetical protein
MTTRIVAEGLAEFSAYLDRLPDVTKQAAMLAINQTAERKAVPAARREIYDQVNFPRDYLNNDRLGVRSKATRNSLEATITGRQRPTSLARFLVGTPTIESTRRRGAGGVKVRVKPGVTKQLKGGFLVRLRAGKSDSGSFNIGLAVRLRPGEHLNTRGAPMLSKNVYLLYGPSVDQVFRIVADDITPETLDYLSAEFLRQFVRLSGD